MSDNRFGAKALAGTIVRFIRRQPRATILSHPPSPLTFRSCPSVVVPALWAGGGRGHFETGGILEARGVATLPAQGVGREPETGAP